MAPKTKSAATNGAPKKAKSPAPSSTDSPATAPAEIQEFTPVTYGPGKPDKALYDAEQNKIKAEIDALQAKLVCSRSALYSREVHIPPFPDLCVCRPLSRISSLLVGRVVLRTRGGMSSVQNLTAFVASNRTPRLRGGR